MAEAFLSDDERNVDEPTIPHPAVDAAAALGATAGGDGPGGFSTVRLFGSASFFRLWLAQVASSLGDWLGFVAITALAARIAGGGSPEAAVGLVLSARLVPGFFLAPVAGVLVDRWDRRKTMVACDVGRGLVLATLPWVDTIPGLVVVSFLLEILTLLWSPSKEASVPAMVPTSYLPTANSLSLVAAYGTFPIGSLLFTALAGVAKFLGRYDALEGLKVDQEFVAIYFDVGTFFLSAILISTLAIPGRRPASGATDVAAATKSRIDFGQTWRELREGVRFIGQNPIVRAVMLSIATGLIGGGMLVPLGPAFARTTLGGGPSAYGLLLTALGFGVAGGIIGLSVIQRRIPHEKVFLFAVFGAGLSIIAGASMTSLRPVLGFVAVLGVCAGSVYVLGYTILQTNVEDALRGRVFASLNTLVRFCILTAFAIAPLLSALLDGLSGDLFDKRISLGGLSIDIPGARLTLWLAGSIILAAGGVALLALRDRPLRRSQPGDEPDAGG